MFNFLAFFECLLEAALLQLKNEVKSANLLIEKREIISSHLFLESTNLGSFFFVAFRAS